jgi:hypothetical protein
MFRRLGAAGMARVSRAGGYVCTGAFEGVLTKEKPMSMITVRIPMPDYLTSDEVSMIAAEYRELIQRHEVNLHRAEQSVTLRLKSGLPPAPSA